jgi:hypothetical protein
MTDCDATLFSQLLTHAACSREERGVSYRGRGRGFESRRPRHSFQYLRQWLSTIFDRVAHFRTNFQTRFATTVGFASWVRKSVFSLRTSMGS